VRTAPAAPGRSSDERHARARVPSRDAGTEFG
jgi:hypothetical protein